MSRRSDLIEVAISTLEGENDNLSPEQRERLAKLTGVSEETRENLDSTLKEERKKEFDLMWEIDPESPAAKMLLNKIKYRYEESGDNEYLEFVQNELEKILSPRDLFSLKMMEDNGGEVRIVGINNDEIIIKERCVNIPDGRYGTFKEADKQRKDFGKNVELDDEESYYAMQRESGDGYEGGVWLKTDPNFINTVGEAIVGTFFRDGCTTTTANVDDENDINGWRFSLKVKIKN